MVHVSLLHLMTGAIDMTADGRNVPFACALFGDFESLATTIIVLTRTFNQQVIRLFKFVSSQLSVRHLIEWRQFVGGE